MYVNLTKNQLKQTIEESSAEKKSDLKLYLKEKVLSESWFWCKSVHYLYKDILPTDLTRIYEEFTLEIPNSPSLSRLHLTQTLGSSLNFDYVQNKYDTIDNVIILRSLLHCNEIDVQIAEVFGKIESLRLQNVPQFLYES